VRKEGPNANESIHPENHAHIFPKLSRDFSSCPDGKILEPKGGKRQRQQGKRIESKEFDGQKPGAIFPAGRIPSGWHLG
jgi:hypothetical protein